MEYINIKDNKEGIMTKDLIDTDIGKKVYWNDPAGETSAYYFVEEIDYKDDYVLLRNEVSETEALISELSYEPERVSYEDLELWSDNLEHIKEVFFDIINKDTKPEDVLKEIAEAVESTY